MSIANYAVRTNYFHVKDEAPFREFISKVESVDGYVTLWDDKTDGNGNRMFGFCADEGIIGISDPSDDYIFDAFDRFTAGLQEHIANEDAVIIMRAGHEDTRDVHCYIDVVTRNSVTFTEAWVVATNIARGLLHNDKWDVSYYNDSDE